MLVTGSSQSSRLSLLSSQRTLKIWEKDATENSFCSQIWYYFQFHISLCPNELIKHLFLFVFVSRVRLIALCCLSLFVVLFVLFPTWLLTQHFNKQGFNNNYYIVFINDLCSVIKYSIYLRFACIKTIYSTISSDESDI